MMTIFQRIITVYTGLILITVIIFGVMSYYSGQAQITRSVHNRLDAVATNQRDKIEAIVTAWEDRVALIASRTQLRISFRKHLMENSPNALPRVRRILTDALNSVKSVRQVSVAPVDGDTITQVGDIGETSKIIELSRTNTAFPSIVTVLASKPGGLLVRVQAPMILEREQIGRLTATLDAKELLQATGDYTGLGETGETMIGAGLQSTQARYLTPLRFPVALASSQQTDAAAFEPMAAALQAKEGIFQTALDYRGQETIAASRYIPNLNWGIVVKMDRQEIMQPVQQFQRNILLAGAILISLAIIITLLVARRLSRPLENLATVAQSIQAGNTLARANEQESESREFRSLAKSFNNLASSLLQSNASLEQRVEERTRELEELNETLEERVTERTRELRVANENLSSTMQELKQAQDELVQSEKMAALGGLVAGVAHELNTPIGIGITGASHLKDELYDLQPKIEANTITRKDLHQFAEEVEQACNLLLTHLSRAADLVGNFKQIAVDQSDPDIRTVDVETYLKRVVSTLKPKLKASRHSIHVEAESGIPLTTCPGALAQALTALVTNCLTHAFDGTTAQGEIIVRAEKTEHGCRLAVCDNGKGIPSDIRLKVFEPFFTTARHSGGSGLGLSIVHNIVTDVLKGRVYCRSEPDIGTQMFMELPSLTESELPTSLNLASD